MVADSLQGGWAEGCLVSPTPFFRSVGLQVSVMAAPCLLRRKVSEKLTAWKDYGRTVISSHHLLSRMTTNVFPLLLCIFTNYFVLGVAENRQSFLWMPAKQCPAISHLAGRKVAHFVHPRTNMKSWFQAAVVYSLIIMKLGLMALFLTCVIFYY